MADVELMVEDYDAFATGAFQPDAFQIPNVTRWPRRGFQRFSVQDDAFQIGLGIFGPWQGPV
jgi:hypothetical protein